MRYRHFLSKTLTPLGAVVLLWAAGAGGAAMAADSDDWPEPVYFPQNTQAVPPGMAASQVTKSAETPIKPKKPKRGLHFRRRSPLDALPVLTEDQIVKVGPRDPAPSPFPLLRITTPLLSDSGVVPTGIYLLKPLPPPVTASNQSPGSPAASVLPTPGLMALSITLTRQNQPVMKCVLRVVTPPPPPASAQSAISPLTPADPKLPEPSRATLKLSPDQRTATIVLQEAGRRYESTPFPVASDRRPMLTY